MADPLEVVYKVGTQVFPTEREAKQEVCRQLLQEWAESVGLIHPTTWSREEVIAEIMVSGRVIFHALEERFGAEGCE